MGATVLAVVIAAALRVLLPYVASGLNELPAWRQRMTDAREYRIRKRLERRAGNWNS